MDPDDAATMGAAFALLATLMCRPSPGDATSGEWTWRFPFLISAILVLLAGDIRTILDDQPLYARLTTESKPCRNCITHLHQLSPERGSLFFVFFAWLSDYPGRPTS